MERYYCTKCKIFPIWVTKRYYLDYYLKKNKNFFEEELKWDGDGFEIKSSELDDLVVDMHCKECGTLLLLKEEDEAW